MTRALILCAGEQHRWRDDDGTYARGVPKQLVQVGGEPILSRTVRMLTARGITDITVVHKPRERQLYTLPDQPGVKYATAQLDPRNGEADRFFSSRHLWAKDSRTLLVYGDVYFTGHAMDRIAAERTSWWAYGRPGASKHTGCQHGEIFAFGWTPDAHSLVDEHKARIVELQHTGVINRSLGWELYRSLMGNQGAAIRSGRIDPRRMVVIDDFTEDFDKPAKFDAWMERRARARSQRGRPVLARR